MEKLTEREWTVLEALWALDGGELGAVTEQLHPETGWNRNTVLTYLTRMEKKGLVTIDKTAAPHVYRAAYSRESCQAAARHRFLRRVYRGAAGDLVTAFLKEEPISKEERDRLRDLLDEMEV